MRQPVATAMVLLAGIGPCLADPSIQVTAPVSVARSGEKITFSAAVKGCRWQATGGSIDPATGVFTAPELGESKLITVRATSPHKDCQAFGEATILVLPGLDALLRVVAQVQGAEALELAPRPTLPFLDTETYTRFDSKAHVKTAVPKTPATGARQLLGYNLPVPFRWDSTLAHAKGLLLSFRDGEDMVRFEATGHISQVVKATGRIREASLETLDYDAKANHWTSTMHAPDLQVRGVVPFAGNSVTEPGHVDGDGLAARFREPVGLALLGDAARNTSTCIAADVRSHGVRTISPAGDVRTEWGKADEPGFKDGPGAQARFQHPTFLAARPASDVPTRWAFTRTFVVSDTGNHAIRLVDDKGVVRTLAGTGKAGLANAEKGEEAQFHSPQGVAMDHKGNVYVADAGNFMIRKIDPQGRVTTLAGSGKPGSKDGAGPQASFRKLRGLALVHPYDGHLLVVDNHSVRTITPQGEVTTIVGQVDSPGYAQFPWKEEASRWPINRKPCLNHPCGIVSYQNRIFVADQGNHAVRLVQCYPDGQDLYGLLDTLAGDPGQGAIRWGLLRDGLPWMVTEAYATLKHPLGLTFDGTNGLYVSSGPCLAHLSELFLDRHQPGTDVDLVCEAPKAGKPCSLVFRSGAAAAGGPQEPTRWWAEFVDPATGKAVAPAQSGRNPGRPMEPFQATFEQPGAVEVRTKVLTDQGTTTFERFTLQVKP